MTVIHGKVVNGRIEVEAELPEGAEVEVLIPAPGEVPLTAEEETEIDAALAEADEGGSIPLSEFVRQVRQRRLEPTRR